MYTFTNIVYETDRLFTRMFDEKRLSGISHALKKKCEEAKKKLIEANRDLDYTKKHEFAAPAGWYECHIAKKAVTKRECELQNLYNQLRRQLRKDNEKTNTQ